MLWCIRLGIWCSRTTKWLIPLGNQGWFWQSGYPVALCVISVPWMYFTAPRAVNEQKAEKEDVINDKDRRWARNEVWGEMIKDKVDQLDNRKIAIHHNSVPRSEINNIDRNKPITTHRRDLLNPLNKALVSSLAHNQLSWYILFLIACNSIGQLCLRGPSYSTVSADNSIERFYFDKVNWVIKLCEVQV